MNEHLDSGDPSAPEEQVVAAIATLVDRRADVIVITRGGGSRGDLSWFDQQGIAVAIASAPVPIVTATRTEPFESKSIRVTPTSAIPLIGDQFVRPVDSETIRPDTTIQIRPTMVRKNDLPQVNSVTVPVIMKRSAKAKINT